LSDSDPDPDLANARILNSTGKTPSAVAAAEVRSGERLAVAQRSEQAEAAGPARRLAGNNVPADPAAGLDAAQTVRQADGLTSKSGPDEAPRAAPAPKPAELLRQVHDGVENLTRSGDTSLRIALQPRDLGRIDLRLTLTPHGASVSISANQPATSALLERYLYDLRASLTEAGVQVSNLNVSTASTGQNLLNYQADRQPGQAYAEAGLNRSPRRPGGVEADVAPLTDAAPGSLRRASAAGVDYRV
jgi:flagellar hook-length control protein FliK